MALQKQFKHLPSNNRLIIFLVDQGYVLDIYDSLLTNFKVYIIVQLEDRVIAIQQKVEHNGELN